MSETILITGASGLIGKHLSAMLINKGYRVLQLSRQPKVEDCFRWDQESGNIDPQAILQIQHIIHLAGANIGEMPWTDDRKELILRSRVHTSEMLFRSCMAFNPNLKSFITASAVGIYGSSPSTHCYTEKDTQGEGFLAEVCQQWETAADLFENAGIRTVKIRTGIVLANDGGILPQMASPVHMGFGCSLGSGMQSIPWIHIDDLCQIYLKAIENSQWSGAYNAVAPKLETNKTFMKTLAKVLHKPFWPISIPAPLIRRLMGERSELLLLGNRVESERLDKQMFQFTELKEALSNLFPKR